MPLESFVNNDLYFEKSSFRAANYFDVQENLYKLAVKVSAVHFELKLLRVHVITIEW